MIETCPQCKHHCPPCCLTTENALNYLVDLANGRYEALFVFPKSTKVQGRYRITVENTSE